MFGNIPLKSMTIILMVFLPLVGFLGLFSMTSLDHNGPLSCPTSLVSGGDCSPVNGSISNVTHHISVVQQYISHGLSSTGTLLTLSIILLFGIFFSFSKKDNLPDINLEYIKELKENKPDFVPRQIFLRWLILNNKLDPYALSWVQSRT